MSEPSRFSFSAVLVHHIDGPDTAEIYFRKENDGLFVRYDDYARLKAEFDEYRKAATIAADSVIDERNHLKAEVERLRLQVGTDAIDREHGMCCDSSAENARLKAEVERLRKAGDAMAFWLDHQKNEHGHLLAESWDRSMEDAQR